MFGLWAASSKAAVWHQWQWYIPLYTLTIPQKIWKAAHISGEFQITSVVANWLCSTKNSPCAVRSNLCPYVLCSHLPDDQLTVFQGDSQERCDCIVFLQGQDERWSSRCCDTMWPKDWLTSNDNHAALIYRGSTPKEETPPLFFWVNNFSRWRKKERKKETKGGRKEGRREGRYKPQHLQPISSL